MAAAPKENAFAEFIASVKTEGSGQGLRGLCFETLDKVRSQNIGLLVERRYLTKFLMKVQGVKAHLDKLDLSKDDRYRRVNLMVSQWIGKSKVKISKTAKQGSFENVIKEIEF